MIRYVRKNLTEPVTSIDNNLAQSACRIMSCFLEDYKDTEIKIVSQEEIDDLENAIENLYVYAVTWSIGTTCTLEGRKKFDAQLRELIE
jgi:dynein heavy chain